MCDHPAHQHAMVTKDVAAVGCALKPGAAPRYQRRLMFHTADTEELVRTAGGETNREFGLIVGQYRDGEPFRLTETDIACAPTSILQAISGGVREIEVKLLMVMPIGQPSCPGAVTMATPVGNWPRDVRSFFEFCIVLSSVSSGSGFSSEWDLRRDRCVPRTRTVGGRAAGGNGRL